MNKDLFKLFRFYLLFLIWVVSGDVLRFVLKIMNVDTTKIHNLAIAEFVLSLVVFLIGFIIYKKEIKKDYKAIDKKKIFIEALRLMACAYMVEIISGIVVMFIFSIIGVEATGSINNNVAIKLLKSAPVLIGVGTVLLAPAYEEIIMRLGLNTIFKNKKVFIAVSGIIFGVMHVIDFKVVILTLPILGIIIDRISMSKKKNKLLLNIACVTTYLFIMFIIITLMSGGINKAIIALNLKNFIYVIEYGSVGVYFAYVYDKYKNVFYTIIPHALINFIATIILSFR